MTLLSILLVIFVNPCKFWHTLTKMPLVTCAWMKEQKRSTPVSPTVHLCLPPLALPLANPIQPRQAMAAQAGQVGMAPQCTQGRRRRWRAQLFAMEAAQRQRQRLWTERERRVLVRVTTLFANPPRQSTGTAWSSHGLWHRTTSPALLVLAVLSCLHLAISPSLTCPISHPMSQPSVFMRESMAGGEADGYFWPDSTEQELQCRLSGWIACTPVDAGAEHHS